MFGKDGPLLEQISDDEDWGPVKRKRREKESDAASTLMTLYESERNPDVDHTEVKNILSLIRKLEGPASEFLERQ